MGVLKWLGIGKDVKDASEGLGNGISKIITTATGKIPPEVQGEIEKLKLEMEAKVMDIVERGTAAFQDFVLAYEGKADQIPKFLLIWRGIIRPAITTLTFLWFFGVLSVDMWNVITKTPGYVLMIGQLPGGFWVIFSLVIGFWFGSRTGEHLMGKINGHRE